MIGQMVNMSLTGEILPSSNNIIELTPKLINGRVCLMQTIGPINDVKKFEIEKTCSEFYKKYYKDKPSLTLQQAWDICNPVDENSTYKAKSMKPIKKPSRSINIRRGQRSKGGSR